eukprot:jgi/Mesvir1/20283/Mv24001-RA.1
MPGITLATLQYSSRNSERLRRLFMASSVLRGLIFIMEDAVDHDFLADLKRQASLYPRIVAEVIQERLVDPVAQWYNSLDPKAQLYLKAGHQELRQFLLTAKISGTLQSTNEGRVVGRVALRKKFPPEISWADWVEVGAKRDSSTGGVGYMLAAKKSYVLSDDGLLSLDVKAGYDSPIHQKKHGWSQVVREGGFKHCVEISQKIPKDTMVNWFGHQNDLKLTLGCDVSRWDWWLPSHVVRWVHGARTKPPHINIAVAVSWYWGKVTLARRVTLARHGMLLLTNLVLY